MVNYWIVSAGDNKRSYAKYFIRYGIMLIGGSDISYEELKEKQNSGIDLNSRNQEEMKKLGFSRESGDNPSLVLRFVEDVNLKDVVILKRGVKSIIAVGTVEDRDVENRKDGYFFTDQFSEIDEFCLKHGRYVKWYIPEKEVEVGTIGIAQLGQGRFFSTDRPSLIDKAKEILKDGTCQEPKTRPSPLKTEEKLSFESIVDSLIIAGLPKVRHELVINAFQKMHENVKYYEKNGLIEETHEEEVRMRIVDPFLQAIGWSAPKRNKPEWKDIDIALFENQYEAKTSKPNIIIEIKNLNKPILNSWDQAYGYTKHAPECRKFVVTNGMRWVLFKKNGEDWKNNHFDKHPDPAAYFDINQPCDRHPFDTDIGGATEFWKNLLPKEN